MANLNAWRRLRAWWNGHTEFPSPSENDDSPVVIVSAGERKRPWLVRVLMLLFTLLLILAGEWKYWLKMLLEFASK